MDIINKWKDKIAEYIDVRVRSFQLTLIERTSRILSHFAFFFILLLLGFAILIYLGFGLAEFYSSLLNDRTAGFFLTVGTYGLFFLITVVLRRPIIKGFTSTFISILTEADEDEDDNSKTGSTTNDSTRK